MLTVRMRIKGRENLFFFIKIILLINFSFKLRLEKLEKQKLTLIPWTKESFINDVIHTVKLGYDELTRQPIFLINLTFL